MYDPDFNVIGSDAQEISGVLQPGASASFSIDIRHAAYTFTPKVYVDVESTSDPQTSVTFTASPETFPYGGSTEVAGTTAPGAPVRVQRYDQPTGEWMDIPGDDASAEADG